MLHATHAAPPMPHAPFCVPAAQMSPWQHPGVPPTPQFAALQSGVGTHWPAPLQFSFTAHFLHATPPSPHALGVGGATQKFPEQQPFGQKPALHVGGS